jgi:1-deoxy-D-xylulose-5-phosphate synthase
VFALDRAGLVGGDGATHNGAFDLTYLRCLPNMVVMTPADENECRQMLYTAFRLDQPSAVRYPRGSGTGAAIRTEMQALPLGKGEVRRKGRRIALLAFGSMLKPALEAGEALDATVVNMRFAKPVDAELAARMASEHELVVTVEENAVAGGAGDGVVEALSAARIATPVLRLGLPDRFIHHGDQAQLLASVGLDAGGIAAAARARLA